MAFSLTVYGGEVTTTTYQKELLLMLLPTTTSNQKGNYSPGLRRKTFEESSGWRFWSRACVFGFRQPLCRTQVVVVVVSVVISTRFFLDSYADWSDRFTKSNQKDLKVVTNCTIVLCLLNQHPIVLIKPKVCSFTFFLWGSQLPKKGLIMY